MVTLLSARPKRSPLDRPATVRVNGRVISRADIAREMQHHAASDAAQSWQTAAQSLAIRALLLDEAHRLGLTPEPRRDDRGRIETDDEALVRMLIEREVVVPVASEAECHRAYIANAARFRSPTLYEISHILLPAAASDEEARGSARKLAAALIATLQASPATFQELAALHSACPSAEVGGSLGQIGPGQTVPEFEAAIATLPTGVVAPEPVESRYGVHIVRVEKRIDGETLPFELVKERIARWLAQRVEHVAIRQYIAQLAGKVEIEGVAFPGSSSPLVQ